MAIELRVLVFRRGDHVYHKNRSSEHSQHLVRVKYQKNKAIHKGGLFSGTLGRYVFLTSSQPKTSGGDDQLRAYIVVARAQDHTGTDAFRGCHEPGSQWPGDSV